LSGDKGFVGIKDFRKLKDLEARKQRVTIVLTFSLETLARSLLSLWIVSSEVSRREIFGRRKRIKTLNRDSAILPTST